MFKRGCSLAGFTGVSGSTDPERGLFCFDKESKPDILAYISEPKTAKYPAQVVRITEPCAGENNLKKDAGCVITGYPRRQLEQHCGQWQLAGIGPQQRRLDEHRSQQQCRIPCREHSCSKEVEGQPLTSHDYFIMRHCEERSDEAILSNYKLLRLLRPFGTRNDTHFIMMKTYNHLFERIISFENLVLAAHRSRKGKRLRKSSAEFNFFMEKEIFNLQDELRAQTYQPGKYRQFYVYEPKARLISAAPYRDRVVHHAFCNLVEPLFDKRFIYDSYACRQNKGTHKAMARCQEFVRKNNYVLKCDIQKYFPYINHNILYQLLSEKINDKQALWLARVIIDSANGLSVRLDETRDGIINGTGLPIGNLTSQFFANLYLNELDYFVKFDLKEKYYLRYMDDFLIFGKDKKHLFRIKEKISRFLADYLKLRLHPAKSIVFPVKQGVDFCGFRIFSYYRRLRRSNVRMFSERMKKMSVAFARREVIPRKITDSVRAWIAHASHGNTYKLRKKLLNSLVFPGGAK